MLWNTNLERRQSMEFLTGIKPKETLELPQLQEKALVGATVKVNGAVHVIRDMGNICFVILRKRDGLLQVVASKGEIGGTETIREGTVVEVEGVLMENEKAPNNFEIQMLSFNILSQPVEAMPIPISKRKINTSLETILNLRPISIRNIRERAKFKVQEGVVKGFREFLSMQGFTEIHTPKICSKGAEGGANLFKMDYFHKPAVLAQSPQFYKQIMVGAFDRVFETAPVFRAEKHNTKRHLNEYTSLDFEMAYIDGFEDIMAMETSVLQHIMKVLETQYTKELEILDVKLPKTDSIPSVRFDKAKQLVSDKYNRPIRNPYDLEPEEETLIGQYFQEEYNADFVFITHYPSKKRPFYAMDDPTDTRLSLSFDCLFHGMEITTGGQRIHDYTMLVDKLKKRNMTQEGMESYMMTFKHGIPPHGGLGIGLERFTMQLLGEENIRETTLFPRDLGRLDP